MFADTIKTNSSSLKNIKKELERLYSYPAGKAGENYVEPTKDDDEIFDDLYDVTPEEVAEYIVENPNEVQVEFPLKSAVETDICMPFFRAIEYKLGKRKLVNITS